MRTQAQADFERLQAEIRGLYRNLWLLFAAGMLLAFDWGYFLGRWNCRVQ